MGTISGSSGGAEGRLLRLGTSDGVPLEVDPDQIVTGRTCVIGASGSGKSYTVGVICEELCKSDVPFVLVDTEGEHGGLKEKYGVIWVSDQEGSDASWGSINLEGLARKALDMPPIILDVSETDDSRGKVSSFLSALYGEVTRRREPYLIVLEEADRFIPQNGVKVPILGEVARRGRKRGLGLMICTQRPSIVDKNILSQCGNQLIGKLTIQNDLKSVEQFFPGRGTPKQLTTLGPGMFYALGGIYSGVSPLKVRQRESRHGGFTPSLKDRRERVLRSLEELKQTVQEKPAEAPKALGLAQLIKPVDVPTMVRRQRRFLLFGAEETVTAVVPFFRVLVELGVKLRAGIIQKRYDVRYLLVDGNTGKLVEISDHLTLTRGFEKLLGLSAQHVELLRHIRPETDSSVIDIAGKWGESKPVVRRLVGALEDRRLVRSAVVGRTKVFRRMFDFARVPWTEMPLELGTVPVDKGVHTEPALKEREVREVVKGIWEGADLESFTPFLYPLYRVGLALGRRRREIVLDGLTGKPMPLS